MEAVPVKATAPVITERGNGHKKFPANLFFWLKKDGKPPTMIEAAGRRERIFGRIIWLLKFCIWEAKSVEDSKYLGNMKEDGKRNIIEDYAKKIARLAERKNEKFFVFWLLRDAEQWGEEEGGRKFYLLLERGEWKTLNWKEKVIYEKKAGRVVKILKNMAAGDAAKLAQELINGYKKNGTA